MSDFDSNSINPFAAAIKNGSDYQIAGSHEFGSFPNSPIDNAQLNRHGFAGNSVSGLNNSQGSSPDHAQQIRRPLKKSFFG
jgi:hypothetical protein